MDRPFKPKDLAVIRAVANQANIIIREVSAEALADLLDAVAVGWRDSARKLIARAIRAESLANRIRRTGKPDIE